MEGWRNVGISLHPGGFRQRGARPLSQQPSICCTCILDGFKSAARCCSACSLPTAVIIVRIMMIVRGPQSSCETTVNLLHVCEPRRFNGGFLKFLHRLHSLELKRIALSPAGLPTGVAPGFTAGRVFLLIGCPRLDSKARCAVGLPQRTEEWTHGTVSVSRGCG